MRKHQHSALKDHYVTINTNRHYVSYYKEAPYIYSVNRETWELEGKTNSEGDCVMDGGGIRHWQTYKEIFILTFPKGKHPGCQSVLFSFLYRKKHTAQSFKKNKGFSPLLKAFICAI